MNSVVPCSSTLFANREVVTVGRKWPSAHGVEKSPTVASAIEFFHVSGPIRVLVEEREG